jgi:hypothetical protein
MTDQLSPWSPGGSAPAPEDSAPRPDVPAASVPTPPGPAQTKPHNPLRGWLIAILAVLVALLLAQLAALSLLIPSLVTVTHPTRTVTLVAIPSGVAGSATVTTDKFVRTETVANGQRVAYPVSVASGATVGIMLATNDPLVASARITCMVLDEANQELVNVSTVVSTSPSVTCTWTNNGK